MNWTGEKIEGFRKRHSLTRKALAELLGVTVNAIYKMERGIIYPSKTTQLLLSRVEEEIKKRKEVKKNHGHKRNL